MAQPQEQFAPALGKVPPAQDAFGQPPLVSYGGAFPGQAMYFGAPSSGQIIYPGGPGQQMGPGQPLIVTTQPLPHAEEMIEIGHAGNGITPHPGITLGLLFFCN